MARRSFLGRAGTFLLSLAMIALLITTHRFLITPDQETAPIAEAGVLGSPVDARSFTMTAEKVQSAETLAQEEIIGGGGALRAKGVWLVVTATVETATTRLYPQETTLSNGAGYTYAASEQMGESVTETSEAFDPGIPRTGMIVFEVPEKALKPPLTLRMAMADSADIRLAAEAEIDLSVDAAEAEKLMTAPKKKITIPMLGYR